MFVPTDMPQNASWSQGRRYPVHIAKELARGDDELKVLHIGVCLMDRRTVVQHKQGAGDRQDDK